jgi:peptide/nickel transport system substrate-binding protein
VNARVAVRSVGLLLAAATIVACREQSRSGTSDVGGTIAIAAPADADTLLPALSATSVGRAVIDQLFDRLAEIDTSLNTIGDRGFAPRLADRWEWGADSLSVAFHINPRARWHDGVSVSARDVQFTYQLLTDSIVSSPVAAAMPNIDSVSVRDMATAVVWFRQRVPEAFSQAAYNLVILPAHVLDTVPRHALATSEFARKPVGTGRFRFSRWDAGTRIELVSDTANYRGRAKLDRVVWLISPDMAGATRRFATGEAQVLDDMTGVAARTAAQAATVRVITMPGLNFGYLGFNTQRVPFRDRAVRRAISMAVDRRALIANVFDTLALPGIGPLTRALPTADTTLPTISYDTAAARTALARYPGLQLRVLVPTSSAIRMRYATLLQEQLRRVGVTVTIEALELNAFVQRLQRRDFDLVLNAWHTDPSPAAVAEAWGSAAAKEGPNFTSYTNPAFDALVTHASAERDPAKARAAYREAYRVICGDAPAVWLYETKVAVGVDRRVQPSGIRADAWWAGLADWTFVQSK